MSEGNLRKSGKITRLEKPEFQVTPQLAPFIEQLRHSKNPRDKILAQLAESSDINRRETQWQSGILIETHFQTNKTNGRVTNIERLLLIGKIVVATALVTAAVFYIHDPAALAELIKALI